MRGWSEGTGAKQGRDRGAGGDRKACIRDYSRAYMGTAIHTFRQVVPSAGCMLHPRRRGSCRARERGSGGPEPKDSRGLWVWAGRTGMDEGGGVGCSPCPGLGVLPVNNFGTLGRDILLVQVDLEGEQNRNRVSRAIIDGGLRNHHNRLQLVTVA